MLYTVAPNITTPMEGQQFNIIEGSDGSIITCTATGYPVPTVEWQNSDGSGLSNGRLMSGSPVNISSTGVGNVTNVSVELMVTGAMRVDTGMYRCSASNGIDNDTAVYISLTIQCKCLMYVSNVTRALNIGRVKFSRHCMVCIIIICMYCTFT